MRKLSLIKVKKIYTGIFFACAFLFAGNNGYAQSEILTGIRNQFDQYAHHVLQEKMFLHTDKSFYIAGEILWFKIYNVDANLHTPVDISKVAYVEVLSKDQKPMLQAKISLSGGSGSGSFFLPLSLSSGNYTLRAYTNWMKNFGADFYFEKNITIVNSLKTLSEKTTEGASNYDIQFFPEGGNLVNGLQSTVAFRVVDQSGRGVSFTGTIIDQNNDTLATFQPFKFGMGHFSFTPSSNKKYKAVIRFGNNNVVINDLPSAYEQGYVMHAYDSNDQLAVTVSSNANVANLPVYLVVQNRQSIKMAEMHELNNGKVNFNIDKNKLGDGISVLTVFNASRQPICERLYFKRPVALKVSAGTNQDEYHARKKVIVSIETQDDNKPASADMSMSVYRVDSLINGQESSDISSYLWLSSDLQGNIESPSYYINNSGPEVDEATNNLMLTQGWRRYRWEEVLQNKMPSFEFIPEYEGHIVTGKVTDKKTGQPAENIFAYVSAPGIKYQLGTCISNQRGQLEFDLKNFYGSNEIVVQTDYTKDSNYRLDILSPFSEKFSSAPLPAFDLSENLQEDLLSHSIGMQVQNAYLTEDLQKFEMPESIDSTAFYGPPDRKYFLDDYTRFTTMEEVMREYVSGVSLRKHRQKFHFRVMNDPYHAFFEDDPLVLLDGVPVFDADKIINMDPLKLKKIEVMNKKYFLGPLVASGIVSYSTYKGDLEGFQLDPSALVLEYEGMQLQREFYSPVYETEKQINSRMPDFRDLLYWSPDIRTDKDGKKQLAFYTSDQPGRYMAVLQGLSAGGKAGSKTFFFDVVK